MKNNNLILDSLNIHIYMYASEMNEFYNSNIHSLRVYIDKYLKTKFNILRRYEEYTGFNRYKMLIFDN